MTVGGKRLVFCTEDGWVALAWTLSGIVAGLFIGEAVNSLERASMITAWFVTIATFYFGSQVIWISSKAKEFLPIITILTIWAANLGFNFGVEPEPLVDMTFDLATLLSILIISRYAKNHIERHAVFKYGRRNDDWDVCPTCNNPHQKYEVKNARADDNEDKSQAVPTDAGVQK